ncbi:MAG: hypothetical protein ACI9SJ_001697 [Flavobacteriaceae bacterium]|jgi:hypothetical protein|uniref:DUF6252 family protein n=1 Tax=Candidatus Marifrigoribacter sp. Uisw_064 TaxID=3230970 RepID=UPI003AE85C9E
MKKLLLPLFITSLFIGCETIEINTPGFQANLEGIFFKANDSKGIKREQNSYTIQGITENEILTIKVKKSRVGTYLFGGNSESFATFEDKNGNIYSTNPEGFGEVTITARNTGQQYLTGTFKFRGILPGIDTLTIDRGVFFEVPYDYNVSEEDEVPNNTELFIAEINGNPFNPFTIGGIGDETKIIITASTSSNEIRLRIPIDADTGNNVLPTSGYSATYTNNGNTQGAESGFIYVLENNIAERFIKGSFAFNTASSTIEEGIFEVEY